MNIPLGASTSFLQFPVTIRRLYLYHSLNNHASLERSLSVHKAYIWRNVHVLSEVLPLGRKIGNRRYKYYALSQSMGYKRYVL